MKFQDSEQKLMEVTNSTNILFLLQILASIYDGNTHSQVYLYHPSSDLSLPPHFLPNITVIVPASATTL